METALWKMDGEWIGNITRYSIGIEPDVDADCPAFSFLKAPVKPGIDLESY